MRTLPIAFPHCGAPAAVRIEIYSSESLDASAYVCPQHTTPAIAVIETTGHTAHPVTLASDVSRPCGHLHVYPTGRLADPVDMSHPHWCDRRDCGQRGRHKSVRLPVSSGHPEPVIVDIALTQALGDAVRSVLTVAVANEGGQEVVLSFGQGRVLCYQVRRLLDLARTGRQSC
ncbi:hypothetical protein ACN26Y_00330 [Micromonospora sp. WMMD558]|uniref:hypothetical protein n=1 Tax=Micromonospora sp. WMMD558 TaxID=3403462 RepID=UPI003BF488A4